MRRFTRWGTLAAAVALVAYGVVQPVDRAGDIRWLICLWAAAPLLLLALWLGGEGSPRSVGRSIRSLAQLIGIGFVLLALQLLRQQVVRADSLYYKVQSNEATGEVTSNVRPVLQSMRTRRGQLFDRRGELLVGSEVRENGFVHRSYPLADHYDPAAFSNIVGFYSTRFGLAGLESTFNDYLGGERGRPALERITGSLYGRPLRGNDLHLTLDAPLQAEATALLGGRKGSVVVLDPTSGAVLALASTPGFDPRHLAFDPAAADWNVENEAISNYWAEITSDAAGEPLLNRATMGLYPPGSTFKTVTAIAALEHPAEGRPDDIRCLETYDAGYPDSPPVVNAVAGLASLTNDPSTLERVFAFSCNTAFAQYAVRLGPTLFGDVAEALGFARPEQAANTPPPLDDLATNTSRLAVNAGTLDNPRLLADSGYGQAELLVTPLQMALVAAAVANDGVMMKPFLVESITTPDGVEVLRQRPREIRRAMSVETARTMRKNMQAVVAYGFGQDAAVPGVTVGGKSGTAEHRPGAAPHAWYIAIAPLEQPRYAVAVMLESGGEGSSVGATLAGQVLAAALRLGSGQ